MYIRGMKNPIIHYNVGQVSKYQKYHKKPENELDIKINAAKTTLMTYLHESRVDRQQKANLLNKLENDPSNFSAKELDEIVLTLYPSIQDEQKRIEKNLTSEFHSLLESYKEAKKDRKSYIDLPNKSKLGECDTKILNLENEMIANLEKQKVFFGNCLEIEKFGKKSVNISRIHHYEGKSNHTNKELIALYTHQDSRIVRKGLSSSREIIHNFDVHRKNVVQKVSEILSVYEHGNLKDKTGFGEQLIKKYNKLIDNFLSTPNLEKDLHIELKKLQKMQGSVSPRENLVIGKQIGKIKDRLKVIDNLRELQKALNHPEESEKITPSALQVIGHMLVIFTSQRAHDGDYIARQLALFTNFMEEHPKTAIVAGTVLGSWFLKALALLVANLIILNEFNELKNVNINADDLETQNLVLDELLNTAKSLGIDCTEEEQSINKMKEFAKKISAYLGEIEKLQNESTLKNQAKLAKAQCDEIQKQLEELKLLSNVSSRYEKIFNPYYHKQVVKNRIEIDNSQHAGVVHKTYDELISSEGDKLPGCVKSLQEGAVVCAAIRYFHVKAVEAIRSSIVQVREIKATLAEKIKVHVDKKNEEYSQQYTSIGDADNRKMNQRIAEKDSRISSLIEAHDQRFPKPLEFPEHMDIFDMIQKGKMNEE